MPVKQIEMHQTETSGELCILILVLFNLLDPDWDLYSEYGYGSRRPLNKDPIWIRNTGCYCVGQCVDLGIRVAVFASQLMSSVPLGGGGRSGEHR